MSLGHLISGFRPVCDAMARRSAVAEATVSRVASCGRKSGAEQDGKPEALYGGRKPLAPQPAPAAGLGFGEDHHAFLDAVAGQLLDHVVGGGGFLEDADVAADDLSRAQAREQIVGVQDIRSAEQPVAQVRAGLDVVAERAQVLDARPDGGAADAEALGQFRARDAPSRGGRAGPLRI